MASGIRITGHWPGRNSFEFSDGKVFTLAIRDNGVTIGVIITDIDSTLCFQGSFLFSRDNRGAILLV